MPMSAHIPVNMYVDGESVLLHPQSLTKKMEAVGHLEHQEFCVALANWERIGKWMTWHLNYNQHPCWP